MTKDEEWPLTIEHLLEVSIRNVQANFMNQDKLAEAHKQMLCVCCGIVAGINSQKQQKETI